MMKIKIELWINLMMKFQFLKLLTSENQTQNIIQCWKQKRLNFEIKKNIKLTRLLEKKTFF